MKPWERPEACQTAEIEIGNYVVYMTFKREARVTNTSLNVNYLLYMRSSLCQPVAMATP